MRKVETTRWGVGHSNKIVAKQLVALEACVQIYENGGLDEHLLPNWSCKDEDAAVSKSERLLTPKEPKQYQVVHDVVVTGLIVNLDILSKGISEKPTEVPTK